MQVTSATLPSNVPTERATTQKANGSSLDYDAYLQLLVAQLKNQDPTEPMDATAYMAQLASFSNVEQAIKTNSKLDTLITSLALGQAEGLIGKTLTSADGKITGIVESLKIASDGAIAILADGQQVPLGEGVTVSGS